MIRITVIKRKDYSYIAFKDGNPFEWATGFSKDNAVDNLIKLFPELIKEKVFYYKKIIDYE